MRSTLAAAAAALALFASPAGAAVRYAAPDGDGPETSCPKKNPCELRDAARGPSVKDGDEVVVLPGTYDLGNGNLELSEAINLHGAVGGPRPVITSTAGGGTTLDGAGAERIHDLIFESLDDNPIFGALGTDSQTVVERVVGISENAPGCNGVPMAPGIMRDTVCVSGGNSIAAITTAPASGTYRLRNVTAIGYGPAGRGMTVSTNDNVITVDVRNSILRGPVGIGSWDVGALESGSGAIMIDLGYSNYQVRAPSGNVAITDPTTANNQIAQPQLADPPAGDIHELAGSPTIDAGGAPPDVDLLGDLDFERQARITGAAPDIGADEFDDELRLKVKAKRKQTARKLKIKAFCPEEDCDVVARGRAKVSGESFKLKRKHRFAAFGQKAKLKLKAKHLNELEDLLAESDGKARIKVKGTDAGGVTAKRKLNVQLIG
jgi:hypothetical protein